MHPCRYTSASIAAAARNGATCHGRLERYAPGVGSAQTLLHAWVYVPMPLLVLPCACRRAERKESFKAKNAKIRSGDEKPNF